MTLLRKWALGVLCAMMGAQASLGAGPDNAAVLTRALQERSVVTFTYKGRERTAEPHALGKANDDKPALLAWQTSGGSNTEPPPGWRVFLVAGLAVTSEKFEKPRADYGAKGRGLKSVEVEVAKPAAASETAASSEN
jgi:hypothetical protein